MSIDAISPVAADVPRTVEVTPVRTGGVEFAQLLGEGLTRADESLKAADANLRSLAAGEAIPIHEVMISMERARLDLMLVVEVRNRLVEGYQELSRMQL